MLRTVFPCRCSKKDEQAGQAMAVPRRQSWKQQQLFCLGSPVFATDQRRATNQRIDGSLKLPDFVFHDHTRLHCEGTA